jgi:regulator-associated protein of mTOR
MLFSAALARLAYSHNEMFHQAAAAYLKPPSNSIVLPASEGGHRSQGASPSATQLVYAGSHPGADRGLRTIGGGSFCRAGLRLNSASGSLGRSAGFFLYTSVCTFCLRYNKC